MPCAVNRDGKSVAKVSNLEKVSRKDLENIFDGHLGNITLLPTDKERIYVKFAHRNGVDILQIKAGRRCSGLCSIQHISNYHSGRKRFVTPFNGVAKKYPNNYLV